MTIETEKTLITISIFVKDAEAQHKEWRAALERLDDKVSRAGGIYEQENKKRIATLKSHLGEVEEQLAELKSTDFDQWEEQWLIYQQAVRRYEQAVSETMGQFKEPERRSAGWLEGFTDHPPIGSAGWLEGTGTVAKGSEGWVEGLAERTPKSKVWVEGYGDKD
jgi:hypothetical protein